MELTRPATRYTTLLSIAALLVLTLSGSLIAQSVYVPNEVSARIGAILPEASNAGAAYVDSIYSPNVVVDEPCTVEVVFLWEGAGYRNAVGWFSFREETDGSITITDRNLIWANASLPSAGTVQIGDLRTLRAPDGQVRVFTAGEKIGFFLVADGFSMDDRIRNYDPLQTAIPATDPAVNGTFGRGCYTTLTHLNPEYAQVDTAAARHVALIDMPPVTGFMDGERYLMMGIEDQNRVAGSDNDFNDLVVVVSANPIEAIDETEAFQYEPDDLDGDGVKGTDDHFPNAPDRAFVQRFPQHGSDFLALEDQYPAVGDADYNDAVLAHHYVVVTNAGGDIKDVLGEFHLMARGSAHDHGFGVHFPDLTDTATGRLRIERQLSDDAETVEVLEYPNLVRLFDRDQRRITVFSSTIRALPGGFGSGFANTLSATPIRSAASARFHLEFDTPLPTVQVGDVPFDPFFDIHRGGLRDVHLPGKPAFADREAGLPDESQGLSFVDAAGYPYLLAIPETWRFPLERIQLGAAFGRFDAWRTSGGFTDRDWHQHPEPVSSGLVGDDLPRFVPNRNWTVGLPPR